MLFGNPALDKYWTEHMLGFLIYIVKKKKDYIAGLKWAGNEKSYT